MEEDKTPAEWDELEKAYHGLRRDNLRLVALNKQLRGKTAGLSLKIMTLESDIASLKADNRIPFLSTSEESARRVFPRLPMVQFRTQQIFHILFRHYEASLDPNLVVPEYLSRAVLHKALYGHLKAQPNQHGLSVHVHHLKKALQYDPEATVSLESKFRAGLRLTTRS
jgi:hypothetical protein